MAEQSEDFDWFGAIAAGYIAGTNAGPAVVGVPPTAPPPPPKLSQNMLLLIGAVVLFLFLK